MGAGTWLAWEMSHRRSRATARLRLSGAEADTPASAASTVSRVRRALDRLATALGRGVRRAARRPASASADRRLGRSLLVGGVAMPFVGWPGALLGAAVAAGLPAFRARRAGQRDAAAVAEGLPEVIDLVRVAVASGLDVTTALVTVADHHDDGGPVAAALHRSCQRVARGDGLVDALVEIEGLGEPARALHAALVATLRHGVPLAPALERAGDEARDVRRRRREEAARALPVKLLFPLVFCTLPALVLLTVVPLLVRSLPSLAP
jgi:tight adherence protein C